MATVKPKPSGATPKADTTNGKIYQCLTAINHDGEQYEAGHDLTLSDAAARPLLAVKAINIYEV